MSIIHYHLCLETPEANLVDGMRWLQSTFANRFNRFRKESGHVFKGRYKAILLDDDALGAVCHYIHLNPVRAGIVETILESNERSVVESEASGMREVEWDHALEAGLAVLRMNATELAHSKKGAAWKVALTRHLRERHPAPKRSP